jgi:hypothetical protein
MQESTIYKLQASTSRLKRIYHSFYKQHGESKGSGGGGGSSSDKSPIKSTKRVATVILPAGPCSSIQRRRSSSPAQNQKILQKCSTCHTYA